jgi:hypothetical protein
LPGKQAVQVPPPQSTSLSAPFCTPSLHEGIAQVPPTHTWLVQSDAIEQLFPGAQAGQVLPQSTSVSVPFLTPSLHEGAWQTPPAHTPL